MVPEAFKECRDCKIRKPREEFYKHSQTADRLFPYCIPCHRQRNRDRYYRRVEGDHRDLRRTRPVGPQGSRLCPDCGERKPAREFAAKKNAADGLHTYCKPCNNIRSVQSDVRLHGTVRDRHLKRRYGLTDQDVRAQIALQKGVCAICRDAPAVHVDHDHATGRVRGMLCFTCNCGLGNFRDDPARMQLAIDYLKGVRWQTDREAPGVYRLCS